MIRLLLTLALTIHLLLPIGAWAQTVSRDPLSYPLKTYGLMLSVAILGGFASWYGKVLRNEVPGWSVFHMIGELATSALAGLMCFWVCEWLTLSQLISAPLTGVAGHMGTRAISMFEEWAAKRAQKLTGDSP